MLRLILHVNSDDARTHVVSRHEVISPACFEWQHGQLCEEYEGTHHVELRGLRAPAADLFGHDGNASADAGASRPTHPNLPALTDPACAPIRALLEDSSVPKAGHNLKYDVQVLRRAGVEVAGLAYDSMLASFVLDPSRRSHGIDALSIEFLGRSMALYTDLAGRGKNQIPFAEVPVDLDESHDSVDSRFRLRDARIAVREIASLAVRKDDYTGQEWLSPGRVMALEGNSSGS